MEIDAMLIDVALVDALPIDVATVDSMLVDVALVDAAPADAALIDAAAQDAQSATHDALINEADARLPLDSSVAQDATVETDTSPQDNETDAATVGP
jgi:hypothetical protein